MNFLDKFKKKREVAPRAEVNSGDVAASVSQSEKISLPAKSLNPASFARTIILRPVVSEKAGDGESGGRYTFVVAEKADKFAVKRAVKELYGIMPSAVRMLNREGKRMRFGAGLGKKQDTKKAIVTLPKGQKISVHEGV